MIDSIRGKLIYKSPTYVRLDVQGVGYGIHVPVSTYQALEKVGEETQLHTYLYVREDALKLYGFKSEEEKEIFELLISVSGIGPRIALGILSGLSIPEFQKALLENDIPKITSIPGIGKKTAQRVILELQEKLPAPGEVTEKGMEEISPVLGDTIQALISLGCKRKEALKAVKKVQADYGEELSLEELIRYALRNL